MSVPQREVSLGSLVLPATFLSTLGEVLPERIGSCVQMLLDLGVPGEFNAAMTTYTLSLNICEKFKCFLLMNMNDYFLLSPLLYL